MKYLHILNFVFIVVMLVSTMIYGVVDNAIPFICALVMTFPLASISCKYFENLKND